MMRRRSGFTMIELLVVVAIIGILIALLLPAVQSARESARRTQCVNHLLQLGVAIEHYESTYRMLPPGSINPTGPNPNLANSYDFGWITQILPYLEHKALQRHLNFDVGIYQVENLTVRGCQLQGLICPSEPRYRTTSGLSALGLADPAISSFAACHHDTEAPIARDNNGVFFLNSHVRLEEIEDGLSSTLFVGETRGPGGELGWATGTRATLRNTGTPLNKTRLDLADAATAQANTALPESVEANPAAIPGSPPTIPRTVGGFGSFHPQGANFLLGDGSVRFLRDSINSQVYRRLGNRRDGQMIGSDQF